MLRNSIGDDTVDGLVANGANPVAEHVDVQVAQAEEVTEVHSRDQTNQDSRENSVEMATDPAFTANPSGSTSDPVSHSGLGSCS
jgi:hypothetical protein